MRNRLGTVTVVAVGTAAGAALFFSDGSSPAPDRRLATIEAEVMTNVSRVRRESGASAGSAAVLRPGDEVTAKLRSSAPIAQVQVRVRGAACRSAPELEVALDGRNVLQTQVSSRRWAMYSASLSALASAGRHALRVSRPDGRVGERCGEELYVDVSRADGSE